MNTFIIFYPKAGRNNSCGMVPGGCGVSIRNDSVFHCSCLEPAVTRVDIVNRNIFIIDEVYKSVVKLAGTVLLSIMDNNSPVGKKSTLSSSSLIFSIYFHLRLLLKPLDLSMRIAIETSTE